MLVEAYTFSLLFHVVACVINQFTLVALLSIAFAGVLINLTFDNLVALSHLEEGEGSTVLSRGLSSSIGKVAR